MCGIGGVFSWSDVDGLDPEHVAADLDRALAHRGADGHGALTARDIVLVHSRLANNDPTPGGRQHMSKPDQRHSLIFNGEIYNYRELRADPEAGGVRFLSASDTEVLLAL